MTAERVPNCNLVAHIRRLSSAGSVLYVRIAGSDVSRLGLSHGQAVELDLGRIRIAGVIKTSGGSPWLSPLRDSSNAKITAALRQANLDHGMDVSATLRSFDIAPASRAIIKNAPSYARISHSSRGNGVPLRIEAAEAVRHIRDYNADFYRGRRNVELDREAYDRFRKGLSNNLR